MVNLVCLQKSYTTVAISQHGTLHARANDHNYKKNIDSFAETLFNFWSVTFTELSAPGLIREFEKISFVVDATTHGCQRSVTVDLNDIPNSVYGGYTKWCTHRFNESFTFVVNTFIGVNDVAK